MPYLTKNLELDACPHCSVAKPLLQHTHQLETKNHAGFRLRRWRIYICSNCGGLVTASAANYDHTVGDSFPKSRTVSEDIPVRARRFLEQAINSLHAPSGAIMLSASAVDAMLKEKKYKTGSLYDRIDKAVEKNLITAAMAEWAHEVRLDANDERHADDDAELPEIEDGERCVDFATALGQFMFVLPARITRGIDSAAGKNQD